VVSESATGVPEARASQGTGGGLIFWRGGGSKEAPGKGACDTGAKRELAETGGG